MDFLWYLTKNLPIFSLFVSKAGRFYDPPPRTVLRFSYMSPLHQPPLSPITEVVFDKLAYGAMENTVPLERVVQMDWIAHLGRPAYIYFTLSFGELFILLEQAWCLL